MDQYFSRFELILFD
jgi:hypothetical protein